MAPVHDEILPELSAGELFIPIDRFAYYGLCELAVLHHGVSGPRWALAALSP